MARPTKEGLDYFPLNTNILEDEKFQFIHAEHGIQGFGIIITIFCRIYGLHGYYTMMTSREQKLLSSRINVDINSVNVIINSAINEAIFDKNKYTSYGVLTSKGIQERFFASAERRKTIVIDDRYLLISIPDNLKSIIVPINTKKSVIEVVNLVNVDINSANANINSVNENIMQTFVHRGEERRGEESKECVESFEKKTHTPKNPFECFEINGMSELVNEAKERSKNMGEPVSYAIKILKNWESQEVKTMSDLQEREKKSRKTSEKPQYANFEQREYTEDEYDKFYANVPPKT